MFLRKKQPTIIQHTPYKLEASPYELGVKKGYSGKDEDSVNQRAKEDVLPEKNRGRLTAPAGQWATLLQGKGGGAVAFIYHHDERLESIEIRQIGSTRCRRGGV